MNRLAFYFSLLLLPYALFAAANDDLLRSKGTSQEAILSLEPSPAQVDVNRYVKIVATFSVPLDAESVKPNNIKLTFLSSKTNEHVTGVLSYDSSDFKVIFIPNAPLAPGMYEIEIKSLKPDKAYKNTKINEIKYRFVVLEESLQSITISPNPVDIQEGDKIRMQAIGHYENGSDKNLTMQVVWSIDVNSIAMIDVNSTLKALSEGSTTVSASFENIEENISLTVYKEVNGHRLPPVPDPIVNNSNLSGIDSNSNGVRDDLERWIYEEYGQDQQYPKTKIAIAMQFAKAYQFVMENDPEHAYENETYEKVDFALDCQGYLWDSIIRKNYSKDGAIARVITQNTIYNDSFREKLFNTKDRLQAYFYFNSSLSGHILGGGGGVLSSTKDKCDFDIDELGELQ